MLEHLQKCFMKRIVRATSSQKKYCDRDFLNDFDVDVELEMLEYFFESERDQSS